VERHRDEAGAEDRADLEGQGQGAAILTDADGYDKTCSCGERIRFVESPTTGNMIPQCPHGNHFLDCPDRGRYRKTYGLPPLPIDKSAPGQKSIEAFR
jgi:hypothetical protein